MDAVNPLVSLRKFSRKIKQDRFLVSDFADYVGFPLNEIRQELTVLAQKGFVCFLMIRPI